MKDPFWRTLLPVPFLLAAAVASLYLGCLPSLMTACALSFVLVLVALWILAMQACEALGMEDAVSHGRTRR